MTRAAITALAGALAISAATPTLAQPTNQAAARAHFESAEAHFRAGEYREAMDGYAASHKLFPAPILLFNIGLCHERLDEKPKAIERYRAYLAAEPAGARAGEARSRIESLTRLIAAEEATAAEKRRAAIAERRAAIARLRAEGAHAKLAAELEALHQLEPDSELLFEIAVAREQAGLRDQAVAAYDGYLATEAPRRGDEARRRREALVRTTDRAPRDRSPEPSITRPPAEPGPAPARRGPSRIAPLAVTGGAVVSLSIAAVFGYRALSTFGDLEDNLDSLDTPLDTSDPRFDDGPRDALIANVMFGVTAATALVAGYLWYRYHKDSGAAVSVTPAGGGAAASLRVSF